jgi:hypothetical protein
MFPWPEVDCCKLGSALELSAVRSNIQEFDGTQSGLQVDENIATTDKPRRSVDDGPHCVNSPSPWNHQKPCSPVPNRGCALADGASVTIRHNREYQE